ncbi:MAG TPA: hypothetical protein VFU10_12260 [Gaiellaceae bacterium]|nr:hypothetical protein [Gaiellaceae bacterium]
MPRSYAITWREACGLQYSGRLELEPDHIRLEGGTSAAGGARHVPYSDIGRVRMARAGAERLDERQTLIVERVEGDDLRIAAVGEPGALTEIAERLARQASRRA